MRLTFTLSYEAHWAELLRMNQWQLAVLGNQPALGNWQTDKAIVLQTLNFRQWNAEIETTHIEFPLEYKYVIYNAETKQVVSWETGWNRAVNGQQQNNLFLTDYQLHFDLTPFRGAGVAVPIFSLRSKESFGVGEFIDLKKLVDWAVLTGQHLIQTLPVNDTSLTSTIADSYPYNVMSVFALHPMYLRLEAVGKLNNKVDITFFAKEKKRLNALPSVDYVAVNELKNKYLQLIYQQEKDAVLSSKSYKKYFAENKDWLLPYSIFCCLRDKQGNSNFGNWTELKKYEQKAAKKFHTENAEKVEFYCFVQYHLHNQLQEAHEYAKSKGILLKGDIPIGVSPRSVDVWQHPSLFHRDVQAGAPPDDFSERGQNWGFPTYNWEAMSKDDFAWWKARLRCMAQYFDAYRIDHILGFFRIWQIPTEQKWGLLGQFSPALPISEGFIDAYGLDFEPKLLKPRVSDDFVNKTFGEHAAFAKKHFLEKKSSGKYALLSDFNTQRKIASYFKQKKKLTDKDIAIREGLYQTACQVLFVKDLAQTDRYHPRISYRNNERFELLSEHEKGIFEHLYNEYFFQKHNEFWRHQALHKLPQLISETPMLCCGEDLGMIPACVPEVMHELNILSLEIERMPKEYGVAFGNPANAPYMSVCTTSTHDMSPMRQWWEEKPKCTQHYYNNQLGIAGIAPTTCETWIASRIVQRHLQSPAMWVVLPMQDWLAMDESLRLPDTHAERINVPDNPNNVWNFRLHIDLDTLLSAYNLNEKIKILNTASGRIQN